MLRVLLPGWFLYILPILIMAAVVVMGGPIPRDIHRRSRRPGKAGTIILSGSLLAAAYLLIPVYGAWGLILTVLIGLAVWKRAYYAGKGPVDPTWQRF